MAANGDQVYKHAIVTFRLEGILDLVLDGFSHQNVIGGLRLVPAIDRGRGSFFAFDPSSDDFDLVLEPCYGLDGWIRVKKVSVSMEHRVPPDTPHSFAVE